MSLVCAFCNGKYLRPVFLLDLSCHTERLPFYAYFRKGTQGDQMVLPLIFSCNRGSLETV